VDDPKTTESNSGATNLVSKWRAILVLSFYVWFKLIWYKNYSGPIPCLMRLRSFLFTDTDSMSDTLKERDHHKLVLIRLLWRLIEKRWVYFRAIIRYQLKTFIRYKKARNNNKKNFSIKKNRLKLITPENIWSNFRKKLTINIRWIFTDILIIYIRIPKEVDFLKHYWNNLSFDIVFN
jgi:hypothetical protein